MPLAIRTPEQIAADTAQRHLDNCISAIDDHIEARAKILDYKSSAHLAGYINSTVALWGEQAQAFVTWRDKCWLTAYALLDSADPADPPSVETVLAALPKWVDP
jgi:hypothetical protein